MRSEVFVFLVGCLGVEPSLRFVLARESLIASPPCLWPLVQSVSFCRWQSDFAWQVRHVVALRREMLHGAVNRPLAMPTAAKHVILKVGNVTSCGAALRSNLLRSVSRVSKSHHHRAYGDCCKSCRFEGRAAGVTLRSLRRGAVQIAILTSLPRLSQLRAIAAQQLVLKVWNVVLCGSVGCRLGVELRVWSVECEVVQSVKCEM